MQTFRDDDGDDWYVEGNGLAPVAMVDFGTTERPFTHTAITFRRVRDGEARYAEVGTRDWNHDDVIRTALDRSEKWPPKTH